MKVIFSQDGNTAVFEDKNQVTDLQKPWIILFAEFLRNQYIDPTVVTYNLPTGEVAEVFNTPNGYNWRIKNG